MNLHPARVTASLAHIRRRHLLAAMFALLAAIALTPLSARTSDAAGPAIISIDADPSTPGIQNSVQVPEGTDPIEIDVVVQNANNIGAFEFQLSFDVVSLQFQNWVVGPFLGSTGRPVNCIPLITENTIRLGCTSDGPTPDYGGLNGPSGDGVLAQLYFHPRFTGTTCFSLMLVETAEIFGHPLLTNMGGISCVSIVPNTPTPTLTATATATPSPSATSPAASATASRTARPSVSPNASTTASPSASANPSVTVSPSPSVTTTTTVVPSTSPQATSSPQRTSTYVATTSPQGSATSVNDVLGSERTATPYGSNTVLSSPSGLPRTGSRTPGIPHSASDWLITGMGLTIGILLVLLLRQTFFAEDGDDDQGVWQ